MGVSLSEDSGRDRVGISRTATRYLCAAAYLDKNFRDNVLRWVLDQEHCAVAPSYSIDVTPVLRHCLAARRRELARDALVTALIVVSLLVAFWQVVALLAFIYAFMSALRSLRYLGQRNPVGVAVQAVLAFVLFVIAISAFGHSASSFGASALSGTVPASAGKLLGAIVLAAIGAVCVSIWYRLSTHQIILDSMTVSTFDPAAAPAPPPQHRNRLDYLAKAQYGNVTIYARAVQGTPFVGCGALKEAWSVAIPLVPDENADPQGDPEPTRLTVGIFYQKMRHALISLSDPTSPENERIRGLSLQNRIFVSGLLPADHPLIDENKEPRYRVTAEQLRHLSDAERNQATHYLTLRISGWEGELDVTVFLYFSVRGHMLYFEFIGTTLPTIRAAYQAIDSYERMTGAVVARALLGGMLESPSLLANAPINLVTPLIDALRKQLDVRSKLQQMANRLAFDFGALGSVREFGAEWERENFFHDLDSARYLQIVERRAVDAIAEVLQDAGYSIEEFMARANVQIDNSVTMIGSIQGNSNSAITIGKNGQATVRNPRQGGPPGRQTSTATGGNG